MFEVKRGRRGRYGEEPHASVFQGKKKNLKKNNSVGIIQIPLSDSYFLRRKITLEKLKSC